MLTNRKLICNKKIEVEVRSDIYEENPRCVNGCTSNKCAPKNSPVRDGINESLYIVYFLIF